VNFECHITVSLANGPLAWQVANEFHWSTSEIARDPVLGKASYFYLTSHGDDFVDLYRRMETVATELEREGVKVIRKKIEAILYDTKGKT
jgi:hypothetical protein